MPKLRKTNINDLLNPVALKNSTVENLNDKAIKQLERCREVFYLISCTLKSKPETKAKAEETGVISLIESLREDTKKLTQTAFNIKTSRGQLKEKFKATETRTPSDIIQSYKADYFMIIASFPQIENEIQSIVDKAKKNVTEQMKTKRKSFLDEMNPSGSREDFNRERDGSRNKELNGGPMV